MASASSKCIYVLFAHLVQHSSMQRTGHAPSAQMTGSSITSWVIGQHSMSSTSAAASIRPPAASRTPFAGVSRPPLPGVSLRFMLSGAAKPARYTHNQLRRRPRLVCCQVTRDIDDIWADRRMQVESCNM